MASTKPRGGKPCGAKNRRGGTCPQPAMPNGRCYMHGGATPVGPALPQFKHGRYSVLAKDIKGLGQHFENALADPNLLALDREIALTDARLAGLLEKVKSGGSRASIDGIWPQIEALIETRRKLVDTESKRLKDVHAMVSVDRVMLIVSYLSDSVKRHVKDPAALTAIFTDMRRLLKPEAALTT